MKYRLLKDVPGCKAGSVQEKDEFHPLVDFGMVTFKLKDKESCNGWIEELNENTPFFDIPKYLREKILFIKCNRLFDEAFKVSEIVNILSVVSSIAIQRIEKLENK